MPVPPSALAALAGATVLANLSASNVTVGKFEYRRDLVRLSAAKNLAVQLYSAAGFGESTADLAWDGHGLVADRGELVAETERFTLDGSCVVADVDLAALATDRMRQTSFGHNAVLHAAPMRGVTVEPVADRRPAATLAHRAPPHRPAAVRAVRSGEARRALPRDLPHQGDRARAAHPLAAARRPPRRPRRLGRPRLDAGAARRGPRDGPARAAAAGRRRRHHAGLRHVGSDVHRRVRSDARARRHRCARSTSTTPRGALFTAIGHDAAVEDLTFENVQAWTRKMLLFSVASQVRGIDLGTGDLSELALGFATYGGDHMSHYGVNAGVPKTLVSELIRWAADTIFRDEPGVPAALGQVLDTPISPELLRPGPDGEIAPALGGPGRTLRAARLLPLPPAALRLWTAPHRSHGARRLRGPLRARRDPTLASGVPAPLLRQSVQARLRAERAEGRLGRLAVAARRLAHAERRVACRLAGRGGVDPGDHTGRSGRPDDDAPPPNAAGDRRTAAREISRRGTR